MPLWTDKVQAWAAIISALIALGSAMFVVFQLRQTSEALRSQNDALQAQRQSGDVASVLVIWERLDQHWIRFRNATNEESRNFEFGQLISYYEMSCSLFRKKIFTTSASTTLYEHLTEILPVMLRSQTFEKLFQSLQSREETFEHIRWLCNRIGYRDTSAVSKTQRDTMSDSP